MAEAKRLPTTEKARLFSMMLEKKLQCPVCSEKFNPQHTPQKFPDCGHMCCQDCFQDIVDNNPDGEVRCPKCHKIWTTFGAYKESKVPKPKPVQEGNKSMNPYSYITQNEDNAESDSDNNEKSDLDQEEIDTQSSGDEPRQPPIKNKPEQDSQDTNPDSDNETNSEIKAEPTDFESRRRMVENGIARGSRGSVQARRTQLAPLNLDRNRAQSLQDGRINISPLQEHSDTSFQDRNRSQSLQDGRIKISPLHEHSDNTFQDHRIKKSPLQEHSDTSFLVRNTHNVHPQPDSYDEHADRTYKGRPPRTKATQIGKITEDYDEHDHSRHESPKSSRKPVPSVLPKPRASEATKPMRKPPQTKQKLRQTLSRDEDHPQQPKLGHSADVALNGKHKQNDERKPQTSIKNRHHGDVRTETPLSRNTEAGVSHTNQLSEKATPLHQKPSPVKRCKTPLHLKLSHKFGEFQCAMSIAASNKDWIVVTDFDGNSVTTFQKQRDGLYKKHKTLNLSSTNPHKPVDVSVTPDGNILITRKTCIEIYSSSGKLTKTITSKETDPQVHSVLALSDGTILAGDIGKSVVKELSSSGKFCRTIKLSVKPYHMTSIKDTHIAVSDPESGTVSIIDLKSSQEVRQIQIPKVQGVCYNEPTGGILTVRNSYKVNARGEERAQTGTGVIEQHCPAKGTWVQDLEEGLRYPSDLCFTNDGMLAVADKKTVALYDVTWHS